ncbi:G1/S-specific cyclin-D3-like [Tropilaelaps mercedesae]|uniref:G1/S-specific cyclin-D3-like n=1 Tax=Tropilaelaps mercedesae TaxID=418985 RepID=A0A1V9X1V5_9ACAR|nr:G1/S-specific cyclin-D3-like [Tropilaelaps mercedesae]
MTRNGHGMELLCAESFEIIRNPGGALLAPRDRAVDPSRAICSMLFIEDKYAISRDYFVTMQSEVRPHMRKVLAVWMIEDVYGFVRSHGQIFFCKGGPSPNIDDCLHIPQQRRVKVKAEKLIRE